MHLVKNVEVLIDGVSTKVDVEIHSRGGSKSPTLDIVRYKRKRITPYQAKCLKLTYTLNTLFKLVYSPKMTTLVPLHNPFLTYVSKDLWAPVPTPVIYGQS